MTLEAPAKIMGDPTEPRPTGVSVSIGAGEIFASA